MSQIDTQYSTSAVASTSAVTATQRTIATGEAESSNPAAAAIVDIQNTQINEQGQETRNLNDAVSAAQLADQALEQGRELIQQMQEYAVQAANETYSDNQRMALQAELAQLQEAFQSLSDQSGFNGKNLLAAESNIEMQLETDGTLSFELPALNLDGQLNQLNFFSVNFTSAQEAAQSLPVLESAATVIDQSRAQVGVTQQQLESRVEQLLTQQTNTTLSRSQQFDIDYAAATAELAREQILESASVAMQSHANTSRTDALQLLGV